MAKAKKTKEKAENKEKKQTDFHVGILNKRDG